MRPLCSDEIGSMEPIAILISGPNFETVFFFIIKNGGLERD